MVLTPLLVGSLGLERYGLWATVWLVITMLSSLDAGVSSALSWFLVRARVDESRSFAGRAVLFAIGAYTAVALMLTMTTWLAGPAVVASMGLSPALAAEAEQLRWLVGPLFMASMLSPISSAVFIAHERFRFVGMSMVARVVLSVIGTLYVVTRGLGVPALVSVTILSFTVVAGFRLAFALGTGMLALGSGMLRRDERRAFLAYGWRMQVVSLTVIVNVQFDGFVLAALFPLEVVAVYAIAQNVAQALRYVPMQALQPMFVRMSEAHRRGGQTEAGRSYALHQRMWIRYLSLYIVAWTVGLPFALERWLGDDVGAAGLLAVVVFVGYAVNLFTGVTTSYVRAIGQPRLETNYALVATAVNVAATVPLAFVFGIYGIVGATALGSVLGSLHLLRSIRRHTMIPVDPFVGMSRPAVAVVLAGAVALLPPAASVAPVGTIGLAVVGATTCGVCGAGAALARRLAASAGAAPVPA